MNKKRERAKWVCLILCVMNLLLCVIPPALDLILPNLPDWLQFLSPVWLGTHILLVLLGLLNMAMLLIEGIETVFTVLCLCVCLMTVLPVIGWVRTNRGKVKGCKLIQIPLMIEIPLSAGAAVLLLLITTPLLVEGVPAFILIASTVSGILLPALIFRYLYVWQ